MYENLTKILTKLEKDYVEKGFYINKDLVPSNTADIVAIKESEKVSAVVEVKRSIDHTFEAYRLVKMLEEVKGEVEAKYPGVNVELLVAVLGSISRAAERYLEKEVKLIRPRHKTSHPLPSDIERLRARIIESESVAASEAEAVVTEGLKSGI